MILVISLRLYKLEPFLSFIDNLNREENPPKPWRVVELNRYNVAGIPIVRVALFCTEMPPPEFDIPIEAVIPDSRYCLECLKEDKFTLLPPHNKSGYCHKHRESDPVRKAKKRSPNR